MKTGRKGGCTVMKIPISIMQTAEVMNKVKEAENKVAELENLSKEVPVPSAGIDLETFAVKTQRPAWNLSDAEAKKLAVKAGKLAEIRQTETLAYGICPELWKKGITPEAWKAAEPAVRKDMMDTAFRIMLDQMQLPNDLSKIVRLDLVENCKDGFCKTFLVRDANGYLATSVKDGMDAYVEVDWNLIYQDDISKALPALFREATNVMQQVCLSEPGETFFHIPLSQWKTYYDNVVNHTGSSVTISPRNFAMQAGDKFTEIYQKYAQAIKASGNMISFTGGSK